MGVSAARYIGTHSLSLSLSLSQSLLLSVITKFNTFGEETIYPIDSFLLSYHNKVSDKVCLKLIKRTISIYEASGRACSIWKQCVFPKHDHLVLIKKTAGGN